MATFKDSHPAKNRKGAKYGIVEQPSLFSLAEQQACIGLSHPDRLLEMDSEALQAWKERIYHYQRQVKTTPRVQQGSLFEFSVPSTPIDRVAESSGDYAVCDTISSPFSNPVSGTVEYSSHKIVNSVINTESPQINPFELPRQNTEFWRNRSVGSGVAALYFVIDYALPILLYVGETVKSNQRWKGEHDCKRYLINYRQTHYQREMTTQLGTAFWFNAPTGTRSRQKLESSLIYHWRSPFNQENWEFWGTPFTGGKHEF